MKCNKSVLKNVIATVLFFLGIVLGYSQETNLIDNGDFTDGKRSWDGDVKFDSEAENRNGQIKVDDKKIRSFQQKFKTKDVKDMVIKFKYKTSDNYKGRGFTVHIVLPSSSSVYYTIDVTANSKWDEFSKKFGELNDADFITLLIKVNEGEGEIYFDDFTVVAVKPAG